MAKQQSERSPLLPRLVPPATSLYHSADEKTAAAPGEPQRSFLGGSQTIRHRKKSRSQLPVRHAHEDDGNASDDDNYSSNSNESDDGADSTDLEEINWADRNVDENAENAKRLSADRSFQKQLRDNSQNVGGSGGTGSIFPLGLAKRKPRWSGLRNKLAAVRSLRTTSLSLTTSFPFLTIVLLCVWFVYQISSAKGASEPDVLPRINGRRSRYRPSNLRSIDDDQDYFRAVAMDRTLRAPPTDAPKARIAAYCTCDQIALFKLLKWLDRAVKETPVVGIIGGGRLDVAGWTNKMYMGVIHASLGVCRDAEESDMSSSRLLQQKDAFYFA